VVATPVEGYLELVDLQCRCSTNTVGARPAAASSAARGDRPHPARDRRDDPRCHLRSGGGDAPRRPAGRDERRPCVRRRSATSTTRSMGMYVIPPKRGSTY